MYATQDINYNVLLEVLTTMENIHVIYVEQLSYVQMDFIAAIHVIMINASIVLKLETPCNVKMAIVWDWFIIKFMKTVTNSFVINAE